MLSVASKSNPLSNEATKKPPNPKSPPKTHTPFKIPKHPLRVPSQHILRCQQLAQYLQEGKDWTHFTQNRQEIISLLSFQDTKPTIFNALRCLSL